MQFTSNLPYKLAITEDYPNLNLLQVKDVYLMQAFVDYGFRGATPTLAFLAGLILAYTLAIELTHWSRTTGDGGAHLWRIECTSATVTTGYYM